MSAPLSRPISRVVGAGPRTARRAPRLPLVQRRFDSHDHHHHDHHHHGHGAQEVKESFGWPMYAMIAAAPTFAIYWKLSQPGDDGEESALTSYLRSFKTDPSEIARQNATHAAAVTQAAIDRNLLNSAPRKGYYEIRSPEMMFAHSTRNFPASHHTNLEEAKAVFRRKYQAETERQARLEATRQEEAVADAQE